MSDSHEDRAAVHTPIAIVGISCLFPGAGGLRDYWANVRDGVDAISDIPDSHWKTSDFFDADPKAPDMTYGRRGGFIDPVAELRRSQRLGHGARITPGDMQTGECSRFDRVAAPAGCPRRRVAISGAR